MLSACVCGAPDSTLDAVERDVRLSLQVVLVFRLSLKVKEEDMEDCRISGCLPGR